MKELLELRQKHPSPYIGLFVVKDSEEAKKKGTFHYHFRYFLRRRSIYFLFITDVQITTLDQVYQTGVLGVLTNVVSVRPSQQKDGVVGIIQFLSVHKRINIDEPLTNTKRLVAKISELPVIIPPSLLFGF